MGNRNVIRRLSLSFTLPANDEELLPLLIVFLLAAVAYPFFLSRSYDLNIVPWVVSMKEPAWRSEFFFHPQHLLHLPFMTFVFQILGQDSTDTAILVLQLTSAFLGVLTSCLTYLVIERFTEQKVYSVLVTIGTIISYGNWTLYTDGWYYSLGNFFFLLSMLLLIRYTNHTHLCRNYLYFSSLAFSLALLFSQIHLLLLPGILMIIFLYKKEKSSWASRIKDALIFISVSGLITLSVYLFVSLFILGHENISQFLDWLFKTHAKLPRWGIFTVDRLLEAIVGFISSLIPVYTGLGLRAFLRGEWSAVKFNPLLSLVALIILVITSIIIAFKQRILMKTHLRTFFIYLSFLIPITIFSAWLEPVAMWAFIPTFCVWGYVGLIWSEGGPRNSLYPIALGILILGILAGNFSGAVYPRHVDYPLDYQKAAFAADKLSSQDIVISLHYDWWGGYLPLVSEARSLDLVMASRGEMAKQEILQMLLQITEEVHFHGGRVYLADTTRYSDKIWKWINEDAGLDLFREDIETLPKKQAWVFSDGEIVWELFP